MRDSHSRADARRVLLLAWSGIGALAGAILGTAAGYLSGSPGAFAAVCGAVIGGAGTFFGVGGLAGGTGAFAASLFSPSGRSTPMPPELSQADALAAQGKYGAAAGEYERAAGARPDDPLPCLRLARLYRDRLEEPDKAARWFIEAATRSRNPNTEHLAIRELVELCTGALQDPSRALPPLARHAARHPATQQATWARETLANLKNEAFPR